METVRKNITLDKDTYVDIYNFAKSKGMTFSGFLRKAAIEYIQTDENLNLQQYLEKHCDYVDEEEQKWIDSLNINWDELPQEEITADELLRS